MSDRCIENTIEFLKDEQTATVTFSQGRYKTKIRKLAAKRPEECQIMAENSDGSILAHIPVSWVKISPPRAVSKKQVEVARRNILKTRSMGRENG